MKELCHFNKKLLANVSNEIFQKYDDFDYVRLAEKLELVIIDIDKWRSNALNYCNEYTLQHMVNNYITVFNSISSGSLLKGSLLSFLRLGK